MKNILAFFGIKKINFKNKFDVKKKNGNFGKKNDTTNIDNDVERKKKYILPINSKIHPNDMETIVPALGIPWESNVPYLPYKLLKRKNSYMKIFLEYKGQINKLPYINAIVGIVENGEIVSEVNVKAIIDTGASRTLLKKEVIEKFKLKKLEASNTKVNVVGGQIDVEYFEASICLPEIMNDSFLEVIISTTESLGNMPYDCLIGWDVLRYCEFNYNGPANEYTIKFIQQ